jgi:pimeloyl-ACP methyl ester carboxylesterase
MPAVPRLYMYSPTDLLIPYQNVEAHAMAAKASGIEVRLEKFEGTSHVAHIRGAENQKRYWDAVKKIWEESRKIT